MKKGIVLVAGVLVSISVAAGVRTPEQAAAIAASFDYSQSPSRRSMPADVSTLRPVATRMKVNSTEPAMYIFNRADAGFVVVSGDDRTDEVLLYTEAGEYNETTMNPNMKFWLNYMQERISAVDETNAMKMQAATTAIEPLLGDIKWDQLEPYNRLCPIDPNDNTRSYTGCVATAASQIMRYWRYPARPNGKASYTWVCYEAQSSDPYNWWGSWWGSEPSQTVLQKTVLSVDYDAEAPYDWDLMIPTYANNNYTEAQANEVARLMYHAGVAVHMEYGGDATGGSGAYTDSMGIAMVKHFGYTYITIYDQYQNHSLRASAFESAFNEDLEAGRPILMGGYDESSGGHEFVCDGRDSQGRFHFNWGWNGESNCYTTLTTMQPSETTYRFKSYLDAVIGLEPEVIDTVHVEYVSVAPQTVTLRLQEATTLTATIFPETATFRTYTWSSSDPTIAIVSNKGVVKGRAAGVATIYAISDEGQKIGSCVVTVLDEELPTDDCEDYEYTFVYDHLPVAGINTLGAYDWTISMQSGRMIWDSSKGRGVQIGSKNTPAVEFNLVSDNTTNCRIQSVSVTASADSGEGATIGVYLNGEQIGESQKMNTQTTEHTFDNMFGARGSMEIRLTNTKQAMYIKSINVKYDNVSAVEEVVSAPAARKVLENGHVYIRRNGHTYTIQGQIIQ